MISLFRKSKPVLKNLEFILFGYIPNKIDFKVPEKYVDKKIIKFDEIKGKIKNDVFNSVLENNQFYAKNHIDKINNYFSINNKNEEIIKKELYENTYFTNNYAYWNITNLSRKYNITGKDVFTSFVFDKNNVDEINKVWNESVIQNGFIYFDYFNHIPVKNSFPINIFDSHFILNVKSNNNAFDKVIDLLDNKIGNHHFTNFTRYEEKMEDIKPISTKNNQYENALFENALFETTDLKEQGYYNHRCFLHNREVWDYMLFPAENTIKNEPRYSNINEYKSFILEGINKNVFNLSNYFQIKGGKIVPISNVKLEDLSIVNCLIFGKTNIRYEDVEKLMSLIRYEKDFNNYYLDNYILEFEDRYFTENNYFIRINDDNDKLDELDFYNDSETKYNIAKYLVQLMNEVKPDLLNHHNYNILVKFLRNLVFEEHYLWKLTLNEKHRIKKMKFY